MTATGYAPTGFHDRSTVRPASLAIVIGLHAAALGALALAKGPEFIRNLPGPTHVTFIPLPPDPPPVPPPPTPRVDTPVSRIDTPPPIVPALDPPPAPYTPPAPPTGFAEAADTGTTASATTEARVELPPLRVEAVFDPRYAAAQQPPYPPSEQRAQRDGNVRIRVTIGTDGRVKAIERLSATSDAFWRATERHALARWRFRPATVDGRPVESTKTFNVHFQIET